MAEESCFVCKGSGKCRSCHGKGVIFDRASSRTQRCLDCGGTGHCPTCNGTGTLTEEEKSAEA